jgi:serine/threonine protein phosphatase PrpC
MFFSVCGLTDVGAVRKNNEDALAVVDLSTLETVPLSEAPRLLEVGPRGILAVVSDGMGGEKAGEVASALTIEAMRASLEAASADTDAEARICAAVTHANDRVREAATQGEREGMGATAIAFLTDGRQLWTAEVGDSRAYLLRDGRLHQISKDQTYLQVLVERGVVDPVILQASKAKNVVLQAVGKAPELSIAQTKVALRRGDAILLCSDGLHGLVPDEEIEAVLTSCPDEAASLLVALANERGGNDNVTVLITTMNDDSLPLALPGEEVSDTCVVLRPYSLFPGGPPAASSPLGEAPGPLGSPLGDAPKPRAR